MFDCEPLDLVEWFWGDINRLNVKHRRMRIKFHNCIRCRAEILDFYIAINWIEEEDLSSLALLQEKLMKIHVKSLSESDTN